ncbi:hypothetical protein [Chryseobacterium gwangjuense]|jgi:hypothetical protein|uniref:hypothetical protein n=1 Tax=Chryseobacterium gwangjuense TaxID=1069980 RepID=UPI001E43A2D7|nr:hypothetical protein [Chryseobacterium gwangjuense]MCE3075103.1 hypothetical protein [Chryseobacterium gwangjuense]
MEMTLQHQDRLHYAEVYASDILELKNFFLQKFGLNKVNENYGVPFLLAKKQNKIVAFASLIITLTHQIDFVIYKNPDFTVREEEDFKIRAKDYCKRNSSENFRDPEQLKYNIQRMADWLNGSI